MSRCISSVAGEMQPLYGWVPMTNENIMIRCPSLKYLETNSNLSNVDVSEKESGARMMLSHLDPEWTPAIFTKLWMEHDGAVEQKKMLACFVHGDLCTNWGTSFPPGICALSGRDRAQNLRIHTEPNSFCQACPLEKYDITGGSMVFVHDRVGIVHKLSGPVTGSVCA